MKQVCMLVTDGAPSMAGRVSGLAAHWSGWPRMISWHCIMHQAVLCAKLSNELKTTMDSAMTTVNFIRSTSSLQNCLLNTLLSETSAQHQHFLCTVMSGGWKNSGAFLWSQRGDYNFPPQQQTKKSRDTLGWCLLPEQHIQTLEWPKSGITG